MQAMWVWLAIGFILLAIEMATGTLYIVWFGVAALLLAIVTWLFPAILLSLQLVLFALVSLGALWIWKKYDKKSTSDSRLGQAQGEEIGRIGTVIQTCGAAHIGRISFTQGLMGSREWPAISNITIEAGQDAKVVAVEGNALRVEKI